MNDATQPESSQCEPNQPDLGQPDLDQPENGNEDRCDHNAIARFLGQAGSGQENFGLELSETELAKLEQHLCSCEGCQSFIQSAIDGDWWSRAKAFLKSDATDDQLLASGAYAVRPGEFDFDTVDAIDESTRFEPHHDGLRRVLDLLSPSDDPNRLGRLDHYEIEGAIGCGGMAVVLQGFDPELNRYVAIKVLAPHLASSQTARGRFAREARAAASVLHPNVIAIHSVSEFQHLPYLVMPYLSGGTLRDRLNAKLTPNARLDLEETLRLGAQIAAGLAAAHEQGLVHRDIKPANILLASSSEVDSERVVITDFGLARAADDATLTRTGVVAGTPHYMSPEQARGERIDHRSDLFSLGSLLFKLVTGHVPFDAETSYGLLRKIVESDAPDVRVFNDQVPEWMARLIGKLHQRDPDNRYQSALELAEILRQCHEALQMGSPIPQSLTHETEAASNWFAGQSNTWNWVGSVTLGLSLVLAAASFWTRSTSKNDLSESTTNVARVDTVEDLADGVKGNPTTLGNEAIAWPAGPWAEVSGRFVWNGVIPKRQNVVVTRDYPLYQEPIEDESLLLSETGGLGNVFVWLEDDRLASSESAADREPFQQVPSPLLLQFDKGRIEPRVAIMRPQQTLRIRNRDPIRHYISVGDFMNVSLPAGSLFANEFPIHSDPMKIACEVHPWFASYVLVQDHSYAAISDGDGRFVLSKVPKGNWKLRVWHESLGELDVSNESTVRADNDEQVLVVDRPEIVLPEIPVGSETQRR